VLVSFLSKIIGDNHQLKGPDISKAPTYTMDLSGTKLTMPVPPKTLMIPTVKQQAFIDIANAELFKKWDEDVKAKSVDLHGNGWEFKGKLGRDVGYIMFDVRLIKIEPEEPSFSFFDVNKLEGWLLHNADDLWGAFNRETTEDYSGAPPKKHLWTYPISKDHLMKSNHHSGGVYYFVSLPGDGIKTYFSVPIGPQYLLEFEFVTEPSDCDFYSPEHNLPEATEQFIKAFMQNVNITLSPEALAQKLTSGKNLLSSQESKTGS
jgi:hypothetical protein